MAESDDTTRGAEAKAPFPRPDGRMPDQLRPVRFQNDIAPYATGSTLVEWGNTRVICGVTVEETVPRWMKEQGISGGWVTAEYSMLPYSTLQRKTREVSRGRQEGRSQEIQRLIGRAMRAAVDLEKLGPRTVWVDCDVLQADGGTRTAAITGGYVALELAIRRLLNEGVLAESPLVNQVVAVSVGVVAGRVVLDLDYPEDSTADVDLNVVMAGEDRFVEVQGTGERTWFDQATLDAMLSMARAGCRQLLALQRAALEP
ncbi:MAG: ribonuclease PH [Verrucomicrobia bacterium]|nr:MAG: ribonuclease PH [Verrucomicrobiota bacterium]